MNKLIILTGVSGTGKTSMAKLIQEELDNVTVITVDTIFENMCDIVGFKDKKQKDKIRYLARQTARKILELCMKRMDEIIVIEYPFSKNWESYFTRVSEKYKYDVLTVKMYGKNFEELWNRTCKRDLSPQRHIIHEIDSYDVKNKGVGKSRQTQNKQLLKRIYEEERRTKICVGEELKVINHDEKAKQQAFNKIKKWILN